MLDQIISAVLQNVLQKDEARSAAADVFGALARPAKTLSAYAGYMPEGYRWMGRGEEDEWMRDRVLMGNSAIRSLPTPPLSATRVTNFTPGAPQPELSFRRAPTPQHIVDNTGYPYGPTAGFGETQQLIRSFRQHPTLVHHYPNEPYIAELLRPLEMSGDWSPLVRLMVQMIEAGVKK